MFWLVIIAIIAGTYYFVQWGKKKAEQQAQEEAKQEMRERPSPASGGSIAGLGCHRCHSI